MILASAPVSGDALTALVVLAYCAAAAIGGRGKPVWRFVEVAAWGLHGVLLAEGLLGSAPRFGFAGALSMTAWLVMAVYFLERQFYPQLRIRWMMSALGLATVVLAWRFPGNPLSAGASVWVPVHLTLALGSYGLFGAAVAHALLMGSAESRMRHPSGNDQGMPLLTMERLTFRLVWAGFALLSATLLLAFTLGESLYGPGAAFHWNHKTVFTVLSWLVFAALLTGRARLGWRGRRATRMLYVGSGLLLLAYVGSRFVLEVILGRLP